MYNAVLICPPNGIIGLVFWTYISCTHHIIVTQEPGFPHSLPPYCTLSLSLSLSFSLILLMYICEIYIYYRAICKWAWTLVCCVCALYIYFNIVIMEDFACCSLSFSLSVSSFPNSSFFSQENDYKGREHLKSFRITCLKNSMNVSKRGKEKIAKDESLVHGKYKHNPRVSITITC